MRLFIGALIAALVAFLGLGAPSVAAPARTSWTQPHTYVSNGDAGQSIHTVTEGSLTAADARDIAYRAVGHRSGGALARPGRTAPLVAFAYDHSARLVQVSSVRSRTQATPPMTVGDLCAPWATSDAAKACSFSGTTVVLMADGTKKPIEEIEVSDKVIATDPETGEQVAKTVEYVFVHDDTVIDLVADDEVITTTEDHPFWSVTDQRFERADELSPGEKVLGSDGRVITVSGLKLGTRRDAVSGMS